MRINVKNIIVALGLAAGAFSLAYADVPLPKVKILGKTFYYYETQKDESLYGIAKRFGFDPEILAMTNREVTSNPEKGTLLYYPVGKEAEEAVAQAEAQTAAPAQQTSAAVAATQPASSAAGTQLYHTVTSDESLYGIAKKYDMSIDQLIALNPQIGNGVVREGMLLRLREDEPIVLHQPAENTPVVAQTSSAVAVTESAPPVPSGDAAFGNVSCDADSVTSAPVVKVEPVPANIAIVLTDLGTSADEKRVKKNKEMEFSRGALAAVDDLKEGDTKINFTIISGNKSPEAVKESLDEFEPRMIVTTSAKSIPDYLINYADSASTLILNAFDVHDDKYLTNKNVIQYQTPSSYMNKEVAEYVANNFGDYTLLVAGSLDPNDMLGQTVVERFAKLGIEKIMEVNIEEIPSLNLPDEIGQKYLFYGTTTAQQDVKALLENVTLFRNKNVMSEVRVLGRPSWIQHTSALKEQLGSNYTYIPSRFFFNPENESTKEFIDHYQSLFSLRPMKSYPVYCATAYDIMTYFIPNISVNPSLEGNAFAYTPTIQSPISLERVENGGVVNKGVYLINLMPFGMTDVVLITE